MRRFSQSGLQDPRAFKQLIEGYGSVRDGYGDPASTRPCRSIDIIAVHDGYTLRDCMTYNDAGDSQNCWDSRLKDGDNSESPGAPTYRPDLFHWTRDLIALRKAWRHFRRADFPQYVADVPNGPGNDGRHTYTWEGPGVGSGSQLAVVWWGGGRARPGGHLQ
jgi:pullulanase/glycogen debranching enzyme